MKLKSNKVHTFKHTCKDGTMLVCTIDLSDDEPVMTVTPKMKNQAKKVIAEYLVWSEHIARELPKFLTPEQVIFFAKKGGL